ncbi:MAG: type II secretion system minor pseudopilin GspH [Magnetococcales bacterium]|nr:type II secretion system minor pseudopilin GspH [Magnetococcales bacterium]
MNNKRLKHHGFTLLEILVVLVIITIVVSVGLFSVGSSDVKRTEQAVRQVSAEIESIGKQALLNGQNIGMGLTASHYRFYQRDEAEGVWKSLDSDPTFTQRSLPEVVSIRLTVDGETQKLPEQFEQQPQLIFDASGERTPFEIMFQMETTGFGFRIFGEARGPIIWSYVAATTY